MWYKWNMYNYWELKFISLKSWDIRVQQIACTMYKCTATKLLRTPSFWKPYKVLHDSIIHFNFLFFTLTLLSSLVENNFVLLVYLYLLTWRSRQCFIVPLMFLQFWLKLRSSLSVAFEVLIINCQTYFMIFFSFNCLTSNFCFLKKKMYFPDRKHAYYGRTSLLSGLNAPVKMMTCYLWGRNKFLRYYNLFIKPTKMLIRDKRYRTYMVCIFWVT